jgi:hypothetical protein
MLLAGWLIWRLEIWISGKNIFSRVNLTRLAFPLTVAMLVFVILVGHGLLLLNIQGPVAVEETGKYINANIPPEAVIETTEMELFGLTDHWEFHFAPNSAILTATYQIFYDQKQPQVDYDFLNHNPDYLITGAFSDWISLYWSSGLVETEFTKIAEFPPYQVFQRKR